MFDGLDAGVQALFIAPADLPHWAVAVRPHLEKMAETSGGRYLAADLLAQLAAGHLLLWVALDGIEIRCVMLGQIQHFPRLRAMRLIGLVGNRPWRWRHLLAFVEAQARRDFGCTVMESLHRPRFLALLRGYVTTHWLSEKML